VIKHKNSLTCSRPERLPVWLGELSSGLPNFLWRGSI